MANVIIFGPTGKIASVATRTAQSLGANVFLAMRDTSKAIPGLSEADEKAGGYVRIQADLTKPDTVSAAVKQAKATRAYFYVAHGSPDHQRSQIEAMKTAGVEFVVFLSSSTINHRDIRSITPDQFIPYIHAQVEINLEEIYGPSGYVAVRPGRFATNHLAQLKDIQSGEVKVYGGGFLYDNITPEDMGVVSGKLLVHGPSDGEKHVVLYGPGVTTQKDSLIALGKALGKDVNVIDLDEKDGLQQFLNIGYPTPVAHYMIKALKKGEDPEFGDTKAIKAGQKNIEKYAGRPATTYEEWCKSVAAGA